MRTIEQLIGPVSIPEPHRQLVCQFLLVFSRFEAALKQAGYCKQKDDRIVVEWWRFASENPPDTDGRGPLPLDSVRPLVERPPGRQVVSMKHLEFVQEQPLEAPVQSKQLLAMVYRVRNNLFHGGKWPMQPERDPELLQAALAALAYYVDLDDDVARAYFVG